MKKTPLLLATLIGSLCSGCAGIAEGDAEAAARPRSLFIRLVASRFNAGEIGSAVLVPQGEATDVSVEVSGVPLGTTRPVHLYTYIYAGHCAKLPPTPAYALTDRVLADSPTGPSGLMTISPPFRVSNVAPVRLDALRGSPHAIQVRTGPADGNQPIFCGDIPGEG